MIAVRVALDLKRAQSSPGRPHDDPIDLAAAGADPEIALYATSTATRFATPCTPPWRSYRDAKETCCAFTLRTG